MLFRSAEAKAQAEADRKAAMEVARQTKLKHDADRKAEEAEKARQAAAAKAQAEADKKAAAEAERQRQAQALADRHGFLVVPAVEINIEIGHVLCFGLTGYVYGMHRWPELAEHVQRAGGAMVAAHPHRRRMPHQAKDPAGYAEALERACDDPFYRACAALETANGRCNGVQNAFAHDLAARLGMPATAGSDAHDPTDVGVCATDFDGRITGLRDLIDALHGGRYRPRWLSARA